MLAVPGLIEWAKIEGGTFEMGSADGDRDEEPVHTVNVPGSSRVEPAQDGILRGGSWGYSEDAQRATDRNPSLPTTSNAFEGFRPARRVR